MYVLDEIGEGHWNFGSSTFVNTSTNLDTLLGQPIVNPDTGVADREYSGRRRPGISLFSTPNHKATRRPTLIPKTYAGTKPIARRWHRDRLKSRCPTARNLLKDKCGIRIILDNVQKLTALAPGTTTPSKTPKLDPIHRNQTSVNGVAIVTFRLTCVLEGDQTPGIVASRRGSSLSRYTISRRINVRDRFVRNVVAKSSHLCPTPADPATKKGRIPYARDDYDKATAFAEAMRTAHEQAKFAGSLTIPRIVTAYNVGDKIDMIRGRNISLRTNTGAAQGEAAEYPVVVKFDRTFQRQTRRSQLNDRRAEPPALYFT